MTLEGLGRTKQNAAQSAEHAAGFFEAQQKCANRQEVLEMYPSMSEVFEIADSTKEVLTAIYEELGASAESIEPDKLADINEKIDLLEQANDFSDRVMTATIAANHPEKDVLATNLTEIRATKQFLGDLLSSQNIQNRNLRKYADHQTPFPSRTILAHERLKKENTAIGSIGPVRQSLAQLRTAKNHEGKVVAAQMMTQSLLPRAELTVEALKVLAPERETLDRQRGNSPESIARLIGSGRAVFDQGIQNFRTDAGISEELNFCDFYGPLPKAKTSPEPSFANTAAALNHLESLGFGIDNATIIFGMGGNFTAKPMQKSDETMTGAYIAVDWKPDDPISPTRFDILAHELGHVQHRIVASANPQHALWQKDVGPMSTELIAMLWGKLAIGAELDSDDFVAFARNYIFFLFERAIYRDPLPQSVEDLDQIWDEILSDLGVQPKEGCQEWRIPPTFIDFPLYSSHHLAARAKIHEVFPKIKPFFDEGGMQAVRELFADYFAEGYGDIEELWAGIEAKLRVNEIAEEVKDKVEKV